jgi:hypothetical protein
MNKPVIITICAVIALNIFTFKEAEPLTIEDYAEACGLTSEEFELFSSVVEAESNRQAPEDGELTTQGRIFIAQTIWNRINDGRWPSTAEGVLTQRGQFSTVRNGNSVTERSEWSDIAVVEAYNWIEQGDAPNVQFFNCRYYFSGVEPYDYVGGNYFSLGV